jgi:hypothetical protein
VHQPENIRRKIQKLERYVKSINFCVILNFLS